VQSETELILLGSHLETNHRTTMPHAEKNGHSCAFCSSTESSISLPI